MQDKKQKSDTHPGEQQTHIAEPEQKAQYHKAKKAEPDLVGGSYKKHEAEPKLREQSHKKQEAEPEFDLSVD